MYIVRYEKKKWETWLVYKKLYVGFGVQITAPDKFNMTRVSPDTELAEYPAE